MLRSALLIALGIHVVNAFVPTANIGACRHRGILCNQQTASLRDKRAASSLRCAAAVYETLKNTVVLDPRTGSSAPILAGLEGKRALIVLAPQLGDFDSAEYAEQLSAIGDVLADADISLRFVGIGNAEAAAKFSDFNQFPLEYVRVDPGAAVHRSLSLHAGPEWEIPQWAQRYMSTKDVLRARAWLNYMAMCAGIGSRGTLKEILRGYIGDRAAPERLPPDSLVQVGPISIMGTRRVKLGPIEYDQMWKDERGYQRPVELATVRLRNMVEVLSNWGLYVSDQAHLARRGATFFVDSDGSLLYQHRDTGVLQYSATMSRPLLFLEPYIGEIAKDPQSFHKLVPVPSREA